MKLATWIEDARARGRFQRVVNCACPCPATKCRLSRPRECDPVTEELRRAARGFTASSPSPDESPKQRIPVENARLDTYSDLWARVTISKTLFLSPSPHS